ncbi:unnamed protein product [Sympodiomycopsis kandeliae]
MTIDRINSERQARLRSLDSVPHTLFRNRKAGLFNIHYLSCAMRLHHFVIVLFCFCVCSWVASTVSYPVTPHLSEARSLSSDPALLGSRDRIIPRGQSDGSRSLLSELYKRGRGVSKTLSQVGKHVLACCSMDCCGPQPAHKDSSQLYFPHQWDTVSKPTAPLKVGANQHVAQVNTVHSPVKPANSNGSGKATVVDPSGKGKGKAPPSPASSDSSLGWTPPTGAGPSGTKKSSTSSAATSPASSRTSSPRKSVTHT